ncbi:MAG: signal peptidase I [Polyangiales bacterium]|nr:signal peptidase I [Myxococcales bacterium]MCB9661563.1 signal peptidase I [Sandaracinaceae bacterium]
MSQDDAPPSKRRAPAPDDDSLAANVKTIVGAIALALFIRIVFFEAFAIDGPSMEPSLLNGDRVVVAKYPYGLFLPFSREAIFTWGSPEVGDVVIVKSPADEEDIVKRVIGVAGDTVSMVDGQVFRNGEAVPTTLVGPCDEESQKVADPECRVYEERVGDRSWHTSHANMGFISRDLANWAPVTVPDGHIVVLGDHRDQSNDSRRIGLIPLNRVKGHALFIYWSNDPGRDRRWGRMFQGIR